MRSLIFQFELRLCLLVISYVDLPLGRIFACSLEELLNNKQSHKENYTQNLLTITTHLWPFLIFICVYMHGIYIVWFNTYNLFLAHIFLFLLFQLFTCYSLYLPFWFLIIHGTNTHIHSAFMCNSKIQKALKTKNYFLNSFGIKTDLTWIIPWQNIYELTWAIYICLLFICKYECLFHYKYITTHFTEDLSICLITGCSFRLYLVML